MPTLTPAERAANALTIITGQAWKVKQTPEHADDRDIGKPVLNDASPLQLDEGAHQRFKDLESSDAMRYKRAVHPSGMPRPGFPTQYVIETFDVPKLERIAESQVREGKTFVDGAKRVDQGIV